jgi:hypothetical protein
LLQKLRASRVITVPDGQVGGANQARDRRF